MSHITSLPLKRSHFINQRSDKNFEIFGSAFEEFFCETFSLTKTHLSAFFFDFKGPFTTT